jgi:pimeloyl-ACP methyl ester carboxylesterase
MIRVIALTAALMLASPAVAAPAALPGTVIKVNGINLHYREVGSGEPLLLVHGFGSCGSDSWSPFVEALSKRYRLIIVDQRGHGHSTGETRFTHRRSAADMIALLDHLKLSSVRAMGISSGGMTLYHLAAREPARIKAMVVIGATDQFPPQAREILSNATFDTLPPEVRAGYKMCSPRGQSQVDGLIATFRGFGTSTDEMTFTATDFARMKMPALLIHGDRDFFFPVDIPTRIYQALPNARLWIVPNGDHVPIYGDNAAEFVRVAVDFLR